MKMPGLYRIDLERPVSGGRPENLAVRPVICRHCFGVSQIKISIFAFLSFKASGKTRVFLLNPVSCIAAATARKCKGSIHFPTIDTLYWKLLLSQAGFIKITWGNRTNALIDYMVLDAESAKNMPIKLTDTYCNQIIRLKASNSKAEHFMNVLGL